MAPGQGGGGPVFLDLNCLWITC